MREIESDAELVAAVRAGDLRAFDVLVHRHYRMALRIACGFAAMAEDAHDLVQEAFVTACERIDQLAQPERFAGWLAAVVRNEGRMWHRRRYTQPQLVPLDECIREDISADQTARDAVRHALASLKAEQREVVELHYLEGYDYRETAMLLEIPVGAVRGRLDRARGALRKELRKMVNVTDTWELGVRDLNALKYAATLAWNTTEDARPVLHAIFFTGNGELVSTDGYRLLRYSSPSLEGIPSMLIQASLGRALRDEHAQARKGKLSVEDGMAVLSLNGAGKISAPLVSETYPNWQAVMPSGWVLTCTARYGDWLDAIGMLLRQGEQLPENRMLIVLSPNDARVTLRGGAPSGGVSWEANASFAAEYWSEGQGFTIAANIHYVEQAIRALMLDPNDRMEFRANEPLKSFMMSPAGTDARWVITMPMAPERVSS